MAKKCVILLLVSLATIARGQIPSLGFCPDYLPMSEFDMERFLGKWYEAERYFTFTEVVSRCVVTDYAKANSGRIYVSNEVTNRLTGVKRVINGNIQLIGKGDEGKLNVKYATTPIPTESTLMVLDTDYDNFAVVWSCSGFGPVHAQNAWLMTRERLPSGIILQKAYGVLDKFKISRTFFVKTDQEGCAVAASEINAANGITATSTIPEATGSNQRDSNEDTRSAGIPEHTSSENTEKTAELKKEVDETKSAGEKVLCTKLKEETLNEQGVLVKNEKDDSQKDKPLKDEVKNDKGENDETKKEELEKFEQKITEPEKAHLQNVETQKAEVHLSQEADLHVSEKAKTELRVSQKAEPELQLSQKAEPELQLSQKAEPELDVSQKTVLVPKNEEPQGVILDEKPISVAEHILKSSPEDIHNIVKP